MMEFISMHSQDINYLGWIVTVFLSLFVCMSASYLWRDVKMRDRERDRLVLWNLGKERMKTLADIMNETNPIFDDILFKEEIGLARKYYVHGVPKPEWRSLHEGEGVTQDVEGRMNSPDLGDALALTLASYGEVMLDVDMARSRDETVWFTRWGNKGVFKMEKKDTPNYRYDWSDAHLDEIIKRKELRVKQCEDYVNRCEKRLKKGRRDLEEKVFCVNQLQTEKIRRNNPHINVAEWDREIHYQNCRIDGNALKCVGQIGSETEVYKWPKKFAHYYIDKVKRDDRSFMGNPSEALDRAVHEWTQINIDRATKSIDLDPFPDKFAHYWYDKAKSSLNESQLKAVDEWTAHKVQEALDNRR